MLVNLKKLDEIKDVALVEEVAILLGFQPIEPCLDENGRLIAWVCEDEEGVEHKFNPLTYRGLHLLADKFELTVDFRHKEVLADVGESHTAANMEGNIWYSFSEMPFWKAVLLTILDQQQVLEFDYAS